MSEKNSTPLTAKLVRELLHYEPESGVFVWRKRMGGRAAKGSIAGTGKPSYIKIRIFGRSFLAHRVAWLYVTGNHPNQDIDHINGVKSDNRICNLRDVSTADNLRNTKTHKNNSQSKSLGVTQRNNKWIAQIRINGKQTHLGCFSRKSDAHDAYLLAKRKFHSTCTI